MKMMLSMPSTSSSAVSVKKAIQACGSVSSSIIGKCTIAAVLEELASQAFWTGLLKIIRINIVLSGDNAVVIALAARSLPPLQQKQAILWGSGAAVLMRIGSTIVAVELLRLPLLKIVGGLLLLWIAVQLMLPEGEGAGKANPASVLGGKRTILIADLVMSSTT